MTMTADEFKALVKSKGTQAEVAAWIGYSLRMMQDLCNGRRVLLDRHVAAVKAVKALKGKKKKD